MIRNILQARCNECLRVVKAANLEELERRKATHERNCPQRRPL